MLTDKYPNQLLEQNVFAADIEDKSHYAVGLFNFSLHQRCYFYAVHVRHDTVRKLCREPTLFFMMFSTLGCADFPNRSCIYYQTDRVREIHGFIREDAKNVPNINVGRSPIA